MKMSPTLPEGADNGLDAISRRVCNRPEDDYLIVAVVTGHKLTTDVDTGRVVPTVKIVTVEAITDPLAMEEAQRLLRQARRRRTGQTEIDPATGEILDGAA